MQALRAGGPGDLRGYRRGEGRRPRAGRPRQDRRLLARPRSTRSAPASACAARACSRWSGAARREDRHHALDARSAEFVVKRSSRPRSRRSCWTRTPTPSKWSFPTTSSPSRSAEGPERAAGLAADRLGHRHPQRGRGIGAPAEGTAERTELFMHALDVDEVGGQLLASKASARSRKLRTGYAEVASIEGFDEDTAAEIQNRAQEYLARIEAEQEARRQELGVADELKEVDGVRSDARRLRGERLKTLEDLAGCATDDLVGWTEGRGAEAVRKRVSLDGFDIVPRGRRRSSWPPASRWAGSRPPVETEEPAEEAETEAHRPDGRTSARSRARGQRSARDSDPVGPSVRRAVAGERPDCRATNRSAPASSAARCGPPAEMIRFVAGAGWRRSWRTSSTSCPGRGVWVTARAER